MTSSGLYNSMHKANKVKYIKKSNYVYAKRQWSSRLSADHLGWMWALVSAGLRHLGLTYFDWIMERSGEVRAEGQGLWGDPGRETTESVQMVGEADCV